MKLSTFSLNQKFIIIAIAYVLPMSSAIYLFHQHSSKIQSMLEAELGGSYILEAVTRIKLGFMGELDIPSQENSAKESSKISFENLNSVFNDIKLKKSIWASSIDQYRDLSSDTASKDQSSQLTNLFSKTLASWEKFVLSPGSSQDIAEFQKASKSEIESLWNEIPEKSRLILDFDLSTYLLIDMTFATIDSFSKNFLAMTLNAEKMKASEKTLLIQELITEFKTKIAKYHSLSGLKAENSNHQLILDQGKSFIQLLENLLADISKEESASAISAISMKGYLLCLDQIAKFTLIIQEKLKSRIATLKNEQLKSFSLSAVFWLLALILSFKIQLSMVGNVSIIAKRLAKVAEETKQTSFQLTESAMTASESAATEAAAVQESVASLTQVNSMLAKTAKDTESAQLLVDNASQASKVGIEQINKLEQTMENITVSTNELNEIVKVIDEIGAKTRVINDIVFKSQLLAVNASIEAARAGHQGKGFGVVATEVSNLATLSGKAASEISDLIHSSSDKVSTIVAKSAEYIREAQDQTRHSIDSFRGIHRSIASIRENVAQIYNASREQTLAIEQISNAMNHLHQSAQSNQLVSQQCFAESQNLGESARSLKNIDQAISFVIKGKLILEHKAQETRVIKNETVNTPASRPKDQDTQDIRNLAQKVVLKASHVIESDSTLQEQNKKSHSDRAA